MVVHGGLGVVYLAGNGGVFFDHFPPRGGSDFGNDVCSNRRSSLESRGSIRTGNNPDKPEPTFCTSDGFHFVGTRGGHDSSQRGDIAPKTVDDRDSSTYKTQFLELSFATRDAEKGARTWL